ncbi:MAG: hypothetical protein U0531_05225 [Dehalococcoidia bacterium]
MRNRPRVLPERIFVPRTRGDATVARPPAPPWRLLAADIAWCIKADHKQPSPAEFVNYLLTPGILALATHRFAHAAYVSGWRLPARLLRLAGNLLGADIHEGVEIGPGCNILHATGIVMAGARVGARVTILQNVTLGARGIEDHDQDGFPVVLDGAVIFASMGARPNHGRSRGDGGSQFGRAALGAGWDDRRRPAGAGRPESPP